MDKKNIIKILVVDDTRTIRFHLKSLLSRMGFEVNEAYDGLDALASIKESKPHIVLMDIMMPNMDGIECCRQIKNNPETRDIKVMMVTTKDEYKKVTEAFRARCDDYITKPVEEEELKRKLDELSKMVRTVLTLRSV